MRRCKVGGQSWRAVAILHPYQVRDLRTNTSTGQWLDIQKAAGVRGPQNPIFNGGDFVGAYNDVAIFKHPKVVSFNNLGAGSDVSCARALVLFAQAGVIAFGSPGNGLRFSWHEELEDRGNVQVIDTGSIFGIKAAIFNSIFFGVESILTASAA
jgi:N4-gp56 family major capsid protein